MGDRPQAAPLALRLQFLRTRDSDDPFAFRYESQDYVVPSEGGASPLAHFAWSPEDRAALLAVRQPGRDPVVVQGLGESLRRFLLSAGFGALEAQIVAALQNDRPVHLSIRSSAAELYSLPWELLTLSSSQFVGELERLLVRFEWPETRTVPEQPQPRPEGGRILVAWSAAGDAVPAREHIDAIAAAAQAGSHPFDRARDVLPNASLAGIIAALREAQQQGPPIAVLHLLCHGAPIGSSFGLSLNGRDGPAVASPIALRQLAPYAKMVRLIVVSACLSGDPGAVGNQLGSVAQALHRCGFQAVVASRFPLSVLGANTLTEVFYRQLLETPASVEEALLAARSALHEVDAGLAERDQALDWASLQLYSRTDDGGDTRPIVVRPYRGLLAFQPEHHRFFFGRDREVREVVADLQALVQAGRPRFLLLCGASGTGKSSLALAGAVPAILATDRDLVFLRMRPGSDPLAALTQALGGLGEGQRGLLVVDQLEEIFTQTTSPTVRAAFVQRLWALAMAPDPGLRVLLTLRVDFIGRCGELTLDASGLRLDRVAYDEAHRIFVAQMAPDQLRAAIEQPAWRVGLELSPGLAERMLAEVDAEPGALPLLQDALDTLWHHRDGRRLTQAAYDDLGGVVGTLRGRADAVLARLAERGNLDVAKRLLISLAAVAQDSGLDTRQRLRRSDLLASFPPEQATLAGATLLELVSARLLVIDGEAEAATVEVAHEALIRKWPALRAWLDEGRAGLIYKRRIGQTAREWENSGCDPSLLYRGSQLAVALSWQQTWAAHGSDLEHRFIRAAQDLQTQLEAEAAASLRREREAAAHTLQLLLESYVQRGHQLLWSSEQPEDALKWLLLAYQRGSQHEALPYLLRTAMQPVERLRSIHYPEDDAHSFATFTADGEGVLVAAAGSPILPCRGGEAQVRLAAYTEISAAVFSPDGERVLLRCREHAAVLCNVARQSVEHELGLRTLCFAAFSADGRQLVTLDDMGCVRIVDSQGGQTLVEPATTQAPGRIVAVSSNVHYALCQSQDGTLRIFDLQQQVAHAPLSDKGDRLQLAEFSRDGARLLIALESPASGTTEVLVFANDAISQSIPPVRGGPPIPRGPHRKVCAIDGLILRARDHVRLSPDGCLFAALCGNETAGIYDARDARLLMRLPGDLGGIGFLVFDAASRQIALSSDMGPLRIYALSGLSERVASYDGPTVPSARAEQTSDGRFRIEPAMDSEVWIIDAASDAYLFELIGHRDAVMWTSLSPDGRLLATSSRDGTTRLWDTATWRPRGVLMGQRGPVETAQFRSDGRQLLSQGEDGTLCLFDVASGFLLARLTLPGRVVMDAAFSIDGLRIVARASDGSQHLFDIRPESRSITELQALITAYDRALVASLNDVE